MTRPVLPILLLVLIALLPACGKKGPVRPLKQPLPAAAEDLAVAQKGSRMLVAWNLPKANQDGSPLTDLQGFKVYKMRYDPAQDCPECRDTSLPLLTVDLDYLREVSRRGDRLYFWDTELEPGFGYQYRVVPFTARGRDGAPAQQRLPFIAPPAAPAGLAADGRDRMVRLRWEPVSEAREGAQLLGYNVYRRQQGEPFPPRPLSGEPLAEPAFDDYGLENDRTYVYAVSATFRIGGNPVESPLSGEAEVAPQAGR